MAKKERLGSDPFKESPLGWIQDTREKEKPIIKGKSKQSIQSNKSIHSKQSLQSIHSTKKKGLKKGWTRATLIIKDEHLEKIKKVAYWDRKKIKEIVDEALTNYFRNKKTDRIK